MELKRPVISESKSSYETTSEMNGVACKVTLVNNVITIKDGVTHMFVIRTVNVQLSKKELNEEDIQLHA